jgi:hypothetical protein
VMRGSGISETIRDALSGYPGSHVTDFQSVVFLSDNTMPGTYECLSLLAHIKWTLGLHSSSYKHGLTGL